MPLQKTIMIICMCTNSINQNCNALQVLIHLFLASVNTPERVIKWASHSGICMSAQSGLRMVASLSKEAMLRIKDMCVRFAMAITYDNLEFTFNHPETTIHNQHSLHSVVTAFFSQTLHVAREALRCSKYVWERNIVNIHHKKELLYQPTLNDLTLTMDHAMRLKARFHWHILSILVGYIPELKSFRKDLSTPLPGIQIPCVKTEQFPARIVDRSESTVSGTIQVLDEIRKQGGDGMSEDKLEDVVVLHHADLGSIEKAESAQKSRSIQTDEKSSAVSRLQHVIFVFGLFHLTMAAAEAIRRIYLTAKEVLADSSSLLMTIAILRPKDMAKFRSKDGGPGFRRMNDAIRYSCVARVLDCARMIALRKFKTSDWQEVASRASWRDIEDLATQILDTYVANPGFQAARETRSMHERDQVLENSMLALRDMLLYIELNHAQRYGDIGRVEDTFLPLMWMFKQTGKHKYAARLWKHIMNVKGNWPEDLVHAVRMNWLCNPTGQPDGFRAMDLRMENNNSKHKNLHSGSGSNNTMSWTIKCSPLIEFYGTVHRTIESFFFINPGTSRHTRPDMRQTLAKVSAHLEKVKAHEYIPARKAEYNVQNSWALGSEMCMNELSGRANRMESTLR